MDKYGLGLALNEIDHKFIEEAKPEEFIVAIQDSSEKVRKKKSQILFLRLRNAAEAACLIILTVAITALPWKTDFISPVVSVNEADNCKNDSDEDKNNDTKDNDTKDNIINDGYTGKIIAYSDVPDWYKSGSISVNTVGFNADTGNKFNVGKTPENELSDAAAYLYGVSDICTNVYGHTIYEESHPREIKEHKDCRIVFKDLTDGSNYCVSCSYKKIISAIDYEYTSSTIVQYSAVTGNVIIAVECADCVHVILYNFYTGYTSDFAKIPAGNTTYRILDGCRYILYRDCAVESNKIYICELTGDKAKITSFEPKEKIIQFGELSPDCKNIWFECQDSVLIYNTETNEYHNIQGDFISFFAGGAYMVIKGTDGIRRVYENSDWKEVTSEVEIPAKLNYRLEIEKDSDDIVYRTGRRTYSGHWISNADNDRIDLFSNVSAYYTNDDYAYTYMEYDDFITCISLENPSLSFRIYVGSDIVGEAVQNGKDWTVLYKLNVDVSGTQLILSYSLGSRTNASEYSQIYRKYSTKSEKVSGIVADCSTLSLNAGDWQNVNAFLIPYNAVETEIKWSSSDDKVASVENGRVSAEGTGKATITAEAANYSAEFTVTVNGVVEIPDLSGQEIKIEPYFKLDKYNNFNGSFDINNDFRGFNINIFAYGVDDSYNSVSLSYRIKDSGTFTTVNADITQKTEINNNTVYTIDIYNAGWKEFIVDTEYEIIISFNSVNSATACCFGKFYTTFQKQDMDRYQLFTNYKDLIPTSVITTKPVLSRDSVKDDYTGVQKFTVKIGNSIVVYFNALGCSSAMQLYDESTDRNIGYASCTESEMCRLGCQYKIVLTGVSPGNVTIKLSTDIEGVYTIFTLNVTE